LAITAGALDSSDLMSRTRNAPETLLVSGDARYLAGQPERAIELYRRALELREDRQLALLQRTP
jgi:hypothetical protein